MSPFFSVIIPVGNETLKYLHENYLGLLKQTNKDFEVIYLVSNSESFKTIISSLPNLPALLIVESDPKDKPSQKRNLGAKKSRGNFLVFLDADAYPDKQWLQNSYNLIKKYHLPALCGPGLVPKTDNFWEQLFGTILTSFIGNFPFRYRFQAMNARNVIDYPSMNFIIEKKVFTELSGFDGRYYPGEDSELCERFVKLTNKKIYYSPKLLVYHHRRSSVFQHLYQYSRYGYHRGLFFFQKQSNSWQAIYLLPLGLVLLLILSLFLPNFLLSKQLVILALNIYFWLLIISAALFSIRQKKILFFFLFPVLVLETHLIYAIYFTIGIGHGILSSSNENRYRLSTH